MLALNPDIRNKYAVRMDDPKFLDAVSEYVNQRLEYDETSIVFTDNLFIDFLIWTKSNNIRSQIESITDLMYLIAQCDSRFGTRHTGKRYGMFCNNTRPHNYVFNCKLRDPPLTATPRSNKVLLDKIVLNEAV